ncbi:MAG: FIST C-terminal domain-containing protein [Lachnospiraceae bacterium]|nr:FIST C-terminal domain-containing protein [Lachnospiraceae bacterium]
MKSYYAFTEEMDDFDIACDELLEQIEEQGELLKNSCGIIICNYDLDCEEMVDVFSERFDFPFIGCTAIATLDKPNGCVNMGVSLLILTADDCTFGVGTSGQFMGVDDRKRIRDAFLRTKEELGGEVKLIYSLVNAGILLAPDQVVECFDETSEGALLVGGCATDNTSNEETRVFTNGRTFSWGVAYIAITGNIKPILRIEHSMLTTLGNPVLVTNSMGRTVYEINGRPVVDAFNEYGILPDESESYMKYLCSPFVCSIQKDDDEIEVVRTLEDLYEEEGMAMFLGNIPNGCKLTRGALSKAGVQESVKKAFSELVEEINGSDGYEYSTILCTSCIARYAVIVGDQKAESNGYKGLLSPNMNLLGFYSAGEFGPVKGSKTGKVYNTYNNETLIIVAF